MEGKPYFVAFTWFCTQNASASHWHLLAAQERRKDKWYSGRSTGLGPDGSWVQTLTCHTTAEGWARCYGNKWRRALWEQALAIQELAAVVESATINCILVERDSRAARSGEKGRLQVCPNRTLLAWGKCRRDWLEVEPPVNWLGGHNWFSLVGLKLEVGTKIREANSY